MKKSKDYILMLLCLCFILAFFIWLPSYFAERNMSISSPSKVAPTLSRAEKVALVMQYINDPKSVESGQIFREELDLKNIDALISPSVLSQMSNLYDQFNRGLMPQPTGGKLYLNFSGNPNVKIQITELVKLVRSDGGNVRILRKVLRWKTSWENWLQLILDADTGEIIFFYSSAEHGSGLPAEELNLPNGPESTAYLLESYLGIKILEFTPNSNDHQTATVKFTTGIDVITYSIQCKYAPMTLFDCKIAMSG